jgi:hypothetical protein
MNAIDQEYKGDAGAVYDDKDMILCNHPACYKMFKLKGKKKYHSPDCKDDHHRMERIAGQKLLADKGPRHAALLENSPRLQRVAKFLDGKKTYTTLEIQLACQVCAVGSIVSELRDPKNGFDIVCKQIGRDRWEYTMIGGFTNLLRIV